MCFVDVFLSLIQQVVEIIWFNPTRKPIKIVDRNAYDHHHHQAHDYKHEDRFGGRQSVGDLSYNFTELYFSY